jgi:hypothetical protein
VAARGGEGAGRCGLRSGAGGARAFLHGDRKGEEWWVPRYRGWRSGSFYRGDGEEFLVHGEKKEAYWGSAGDDFIPYMTIFFY